MTGRYYNVAGQLGVLVSKGNNAGWSTENYPEIAYDSRIVEYWLKERPSSEEMQKFLESLGYHNVYMGGYDTLEIVYIPKGTMFCILCCDGEESVEYPETLGMMKA